MVPSILTSVISSEPQHDDCRLWWGIDLTQRFTHPHDFRYLLWTELFETWIARFIQSQEQALAAHQATRPEKPDGTYVKKLEDLRNDLALQRTKQTVYRRLHDAWPTQLLQTLESPVTCEWCGRLTIRIGLDPKNPRQILRAGGASFNNVSDLRAFHTPGRALCPACSFAFKTLQETPGTPPMNTPYHIVYMPETGWTFYPNTTRWYTLPLVTASPALWCTMTHDVKSQAQKHWLTTAWPTHDPGIAAVWIDGRTYFLDASRLDSFQQDAVTHIAVFHDLWSQASSSAAKRDVATQYREYGRALRSALQDTLQLPKVSPLHPILRWLSLPRLDNLP